MSKRPTRLIATALALALTVAGIAYAAEAPTVIRLGNLVLTVDGDITPKLLPKHQLASIGFRASGKLETEDGSHPPAITHTSFDIDKNVVVDVSGIPVCHRSQLEARSSAAARAACPGAILGEGKATVEVEFEEQSPFSASGPLILFNGGVRNGVTTFYLQAYVAIPAPTAIVAVATATREHRGPYGLHFETSVPVIAGGSGSVTSFELGASRYTEYKGKRRSFVFARCPTGRILAQGVVEFRDSTRLRGNIVRSCGATG